MWRVRLVVSPPDRKWPIIRPFLAAKGRPTESGRKTGDAPDRRLLAGVPRLHRPGRVGGAGDGWLRVPGRLGRPRLDRLHPWSGSHQLAWGRPDGAGVP